MFFDDIATRDNSKAPKVDVYIAGFPCQPFSIAGKQRGFEDARGTTFYNVLDYIEHQQPKVFILENVKGITSLENGKYLKAILKSLSRIGCSTVTKPGGDSTYNGETGTYDFYHQVLNTSEHGIPQHRARWYCVGIRKSCFKQNHKQVFDFP